MQSSPPNGGEDVGKMTFGSNGINLTLGPFICSLPAGEMAAGEFSRNAFMGPARVPGSQTAPRSGAIGVPPHHVMELAEGGRHSCVEPYSERDTSVLRRNNLWRTFVAGVPSRIPPAAIVLQSPPPLSSQPEPGSAHIAGRSNTLAPRPHAHKRHSSTLAGLERHVGVDPESLRKLGGSDEILADETEEAIAIAIRLELQEAIEDLDTAAKDARAYRTANRQPDENIYEHDKKNLSRTIRYLNAHIPGLSLRPTPFDTPADFAAHLKATADKPRHERALVRMGQASAHYAVVDYMVKEKKPGDAKNPVSVICADASQITTTAVALGIGRMGREIKSALPHAVASYALTDAQRSPKDCIMFALLYATKISLNRHLFRELHAKQLSGEPIDDGKRPRDPSNEDKNIYVITDSTHLLPADFLEEAHSEKALDKYFASRPDQKETRAGKTAMKNLEDNLLTTPRDGKVYATTVEEERIALLENASKHYSSQLSNETNV